MTQKNSVQFLQKLLLKNRYNRWKYSYMYNVQVFILAAGKGTRLKTTVPKVLFPLNGKPMVRYLLESLNDFDSTEKPLLIVSTENKNEIKKELSMFQFETAIQLEQRGTADAVNSGLEYLKTKSHIPDHIIVLYGDHPFIKKESIESLIETHINGNNCITLLTTRVNNFDDENELYFRWGRIIRDDNQKVKSIVEYKDADEQTRQITEVNPGIYCFKTQWLLENVQKIQNNNAQNEFYLTDLIQIASRDNFPMGDFKINCKEVLGINTQEHVLIAQQYLDSQKKR